MTFLSKHFNELVGMDWPTIIVIAVICGFAGYFLREYLASPPMIVFIYPVLVVFSMLAQYTFTQLEFYSPRKLDQWLMWTVLASIAGNMIGVLLVAGVASLRDRYGRAGSDRGPAGRRPASS